MDPQFVASVSVALPVLSVAVVAAVYLSAKKLYPRALGGARAQLVVALSGSSGMGGS